MVAKIDEIRLTRLEQQKSVVVVESGFKDIVYAVDRKNQAMYVINKKTGHELEISAENVYAFCHELMDINNIYIQEVG